MPLDSATLESLGRFAARSRLRRAALRALAATLPRSELPDVADQYAALDTDRDGRVTRREVVNALSRLSSAARSAAAEALAQEDSGGSAASEDGASSQQGGASDAGDEGADRAGAMLSDAEVQCAAEALDPDSDGVVSFQDFAAAVLRPSHLFPAGARIAAIVCCVRAHLSSDVLPRRSGGGAHAAAGGCGARALAQPRARGV